MPPHARFSGGRSAVRVLSALALLGGFFMWGGELGAKTAAEIDAAADRTLQRFETQVAGGGELLGKAKGALVMPGVIKGAFIIGGQYGEGALRVAGRSVAYYNLASGSIGFSFGAQAKDIVVLFMTDAALNQFRASRGWEVGLDGNIALITIGGGERVDFTKVNDPIIGFVFDPQGLMVDLSLKGAKFTRIER
jgi:lipid-binding SYLF domain-containing protein